MVAIVSSALIALIEAGGWMIWWIQEQQLERLVVTR